MHQHRKDLMIRPSPAPLSRPAPRLDGLRDAWPAASQLPGHGALEYAALAAQAWTFAVAFPVLATLPFWVLPLMATPGERG